jgi:hypothetical protein
MLQILGNRPKPLAVKILLHFLPVNMKLSGANCQDCQKYQTGRLSGARAGSLRQHLPQRWLPISAMCGNFGISGNPKKLPFIFETF